MTTTSYSIYIGVLSRMLSAVVHTFSWSHILNIKADGGCLPSSCETSHWVCP